MKELGIAEAIFQKLLDHFWLVKSISGLQPFQLFPKGSLISYSMLCRQAGVPFMTHSAGGPLEEVAIFCYQKRWPPINALAVNQDSHYPGPGYFSAPGCSHTLAGWVDDVGAVLAFDRYPKIAPPLS